MPDKKQAPSSIPTNELLAKLLENDPSSLTSLCGYVGPSETEGSIKLYGSPENLSQSVEISEADIVHFEQVPAEELPFGAVIVWIKTDAKLKHEVRTQVTGDQVVEAAQNTIIRGRLRMRLGSRLDKRVVCQSLCLLSDCDPSCVQRCTNPCDPGPSVCFANQPNFPRQLRRNKFWR